MTQTVPTPDRLQCVVHLGFVGSRLLRDGEERPVDQDDVFHELVLIELVKRLKKLHEELKLSPSDFFCGISQIAIGADTLFTRACQVLKIPQRIFLPIPRDLYLRDMGSDGEPDFLDEEREAAGYLLDHSTHIIQERVASDEADRPARFEDTNLEILRVSEVVVCLIRAGSVGKAGGTGSLLDLAKKRQLPVLELRLFDLGGVPKLEETWHNREVFNHRPLPDPLANIPMRVAREPSKLNISEYCGALKRNVSARANWRRRTFGYSALTIITAHIIATVLATRALQLHSDPSHPYLWLLVLLELVLLIIGLVVHNRLHHSKATRVWALSRISAEIARSIQAMPDVHVYLRHLFDLPFPEELRSLLRTLSVVHLQSTRKSSDSWEHKRDTYVTHRLRNPKSGQIHYYAVQKDKASRWLRIARIAFLVCSFLAIGATATELAHLGDLHLWEWLLSRVWAVAPVLEPYKEMMASFLGPAAVVLPVLAVGVLSFAAALDLEARVHTYEEISDFLEKQVLRLKQAESEREFERLLLETEKRLLSETTAWFSRRYFTSVS